MHASFYQCLLAMPVFIPGNMLWLSCLYGIALSKRCNGHGFQCPLEVWIRSVLFAGSVWAIITNYDYLALSIYFMIVESLVYLDQLMRVTKYYLFLFYQLFIH